MALLLCGKWSLDDWGFNIEVRQDGWTIGVLGAGDEEAREIKR